MFDKAKDKAFWATVRESDVYARHRAAIKAEYDRYFQVPPSPHTAKEILENNDHGKHFRHLCQLQSAALMALIYPENEEYYNNLVDIVWTYCNEYTWAPLGHYNSYYNCTPADYDAGLIDIFAASTGFSLAEIKQLFADRFPKLLTDRITAEIRRHIIEPYLTRKFFWEKHDNNWTAVCTGAVGGTLMYEDPEAFLENQERLHASMECYLAPYGDDGMCVEGTAYWGFGFGFFATYAMLEKEFTNGKVDWFARPKVKAIGSYVQEMFLEPAVMATYGDCNQKEGYWVGLHHMMHAVYPDVVEPLPLNKATYCTYTHFAFGLRSVVYYDPAAVCESLEKRTYCRAGSSYFTKRTPYYGFGVKGGNNGESHNHIDVGTFIIGRHNRQVICDFGYPGPGAHTGDYHGKDRYTNFNPSGFGHSIPYFGTTNQSSRALEGVRTLTVYDEKTETVTLDMTHAYYNVAGVNSLVRAFHFVGDDTIEMTDTYDYTGDETVTERLITNIQPRVEGNALYLDDMCITLASNATLNVVEQPYFDQFPDAEGKFARICYCLDYAMAKGEKSFKLTITMPTPSKLG